MLESDFRIDHMPASNMLTLAEETDIIDIPKEELRVFFHDLQRRQKPLYNYIVGLELKIPQYLCGPFETGFYTGLNSIPEAEKDIELSPEHMSLTWNTIRGWREGKYNPDVIINGSVPENGNPWMEVSKYSIDQGVAEKLIEPYSPRFVRDFHKLTSMMDPDQREVVELGADIAIIPFILRNRSEG